MSKTKKMRGFTINHSVDMTMKYKFVDRGGNYVYEVSSTSAGKIMGIVRVDWGKGTVHSDLIPTDSDVTEPVQDDMRLSRNSPEGCTHSWQNIDPTSNILTCQRCGVEKPYRAVVACDHSFQWSAEDGVEVCAYCKEVRI